LYVGTSGWAYPAWKPDFYPADLPQKRFLEHYGTVLTACEINATFYRRQSDETFRKWSDAVPEDFRFAVKAHRGLSYAMNLSLHEGRRALIAEFSESVAILGRKLGAVMLQFPHKDPQPDALLTLIDALPPTVPYAMDFKKEAWDTPELRDELVARNSTLCWSDWTGEPPDALPPGPVGYVRLRLARYEEDQRSKWLERLQADARDRDVYVFVKHETGPANDPFAGVALARWLADAASVKPDA
jgi:uncharacterized protein YecE (DUF72 family)